MTSWRDILAKHGFSLALFHSRWGLFPGDAASNLSALLRYAVPPEESAGNQWAAEAPPKPIGNPVPTLSDDDTHKLKGLGVKGGNVAADTSSGKYVDDEWRDILSGHGFSAHAEILKTIWREDDLD